MKIPGYWQKETGDELRPAVVAYLHGETLNPRQVLLMQLYLKQWIEADVWQVDDEMQELRRLVLLIDSQPKIDAWLERALDSAIDPL